MSIRHLADFLMQCRLARCEEEYDTVETLEIGPYDAISYARLICSGQTITFKVCATAGVTASIGFDAARSGVEILPMFRQNDASRISMDFEANRSAWYTLRIANESSVAVDCRVEINAKKRCPSARRKLEAIVNRTLDFAGRRERLHDVLPTSPKGLPLDESDSRNGSVGTCELHVRPLIQKPNLFRISV